MKFLSKIKPEWPLRIALGAMYCYSGTDLIRHPADWYGFAPQWFMNIVTHFVTTDGFLRVQGSVELLTGFALLLWFLPRIIFKIASAIGTLEMLLIILLAGVDLVTFRDIGLFGGFLALVVIAFSANEVAPASHN